MVLPTLTPEQRQEALQQAALARSVRAEIRRRLMHSEMSVKEVLERAHIDSIVGKIKVRTMLESLPSVKKRDTDKVLKEMKIAENRRLRGLGNLQMARLIERFD